MITEKLTRITTLVAPRLGDCGPGRAENGHPGHDYQHKRYGAAGCPFAAV